MEQGPKIHIAFADDHTLVRKGIIALLDEAEHIEVVIEADDGVELLEKLESAAVLPEICIIDISMPYMDGYTVLLEIRRRWPGMKTLVLTSFSAELYIIRMMQAGANGYILKKSAVDELKTALESIYTHGYYYSACANSTLFYLIQTKALKPISFTDSEMELLRLSCSELTYEQIARKMKTTFRSIEGYRDRLFSKLNISSRVELALYAVQYGLVSLEVNPSGKSVLPNLKNI